MSQEHEYQKRLEEQRELDRENKEKLEAKRQKKSLRKLAGNITNEFGVKNAASLVGFLEMRDIFFFVALMSSLLKDILDPFGSALFGICIVFALMAATVTAVAMFICGAGVRQRKKRKLIKRLVTNKWVILAVGTIFETIPIIDIVPVETITTFIIFIFILRERRTAQAEQQEELAQAANAYAQN